MSLTKSNNPINPINKSTPESAMDKPNITYYVIHMAKDEIRLENIAENQAILKHPIQNFDAVVGKEIDLKSLHSFDEALVDNFTTNPRKSKYKSIGEVGCYLSHFNLIKSIAESGDKLGYTVVFEDDFTIKIDNLEDKIYSSINAINNTPFNFDMLYLGNLKRKYRLGDTNYGERLVNDIYFPDKTKPIWGTHAYVVKNANAQKIYEKLRNMNLAIDNKYTELVQHGELEVFLLTPTVVDQNAKYISTITGTYVNPKESLPNKEFAVVAQTRAPHVKMTNKELQIMFNNTIAIYLMGNPHIPNDVEIPEVEVKFGTRGVKRITKIDYDNVIKKLVSLGFSPNKQDGEYLLRMENQTIDYNTGRFKMSNVRLELEGLKTIQTYCSAGTIESVWYNLNMTSKNEVFHKNEKVANVEFDEYNFILSYKMERNVNKRTDNGAEIVEGWDNSKKIFRYINRVTFQKEGLPFKIDMSIVKSSARENRNYKLATSMIEANLFTNPESYEIEIEIDNKKLDAYPLSFDKITPEFIQTNLRKVIKYVLSGLQETNYPISYVEQNDVLLNYMNLIHSGKQTNDKRVDSRDFIGPSSVTLLMKNIAPPNKNSNAINIRTGYVVTEKADGSRSLLYISAVGKIYLITPAMKVIFTGAKTEEKMIFNSLLDGELILHDKHKNYYNTFAAFDVYYVNKEDIRHHYFMPSENEDVAKSRYSILSNIVSALNLQPVTESEIASPIKVICKRFLPIGNSSIFDACNDILTNIEEGTFEYEVDGLIFTPISLGVGSYEKGFAGKLGRVTWEASFKWKPPKYNTIDFLVSTIKNPSSGQDKITSIFEGGVNTNQSNNENQFKTLILRCGVDEKNDMYLNPCQDIIDDNMPEFIADTKNTYQPKQFYPTTPYDPSAGICNILLQKDVNDSLQMFTQEGDVFDDNTIVEFSYDKDNSNKENVWRWTPLRVRYDKTGELRNGAKEYGNSYRTANSNWESIHNPISEDMLTTGENIPEEVIDDDVYYNSTTNVTTTQGLRDFHNLFVKKMLIMSVGRQGDTLIDVACGRAGDLPKWVSRNLSFVFGIDVSQQNLENKTNGACARYLNYRKQYKQVPYALFAHGTSALNIRSGEAMYSEKASELTRAVFGQGEKNVVKLGKGVARQFAKGANGFNITSCQFALHYFFENKETFFNFIRNVAECTKLGGYFIGTSYDGETLFDRLRSTRTGESISINAYEDKKMWEITKEYNYSTYDSEDTCLGYKINVFQESINKSFHEYLVNYSYLTRIMADYGFRLINKNEARAMGFNDGTGMFYDMFNSMMHEIKRDPSKEAEYKNAPNMTPNEKTISFLNRYFIYKKISNENAEQLTEMFLHKDASEVVNEEIETRDIVKKIKRFESNEEGEVDEGEDVVVTAPVPEKKSAKPVKPRVSKLGKKLALVPATETISTVDVSEIEDVLDIPNMPSAIETPVSVEEIADIPNKIGNMYDEDVVLSFHSKSPDAPFPGEGTAEQISAGHKKEYEPLHQILQWRKKLSNPWVAPFVLDGRRWNSVENYVQGSKFRMNNPEFYAQFSLDSGSEVSKDSTLAKHMGAKDNAHKHRPADIHIDEDFNNTNRSSEELFRAQYAKFTQNEELLKLLLATKRSKLTHLIGKGKSTPPYNELMYIRHMLSQQKK